jgi:hypothetical protein
MRSRLPSPATVLAGLALFVSLGGTGIAAIGFARNAGAVDGKSAVGAGASPAQARGKLIAAGKNGRIAAKFLGGVSRSSTFFLLTPVPDQEQTGTAVEIAGQKGVGTLTAACRDGNVATGIEAPVVHMLFTNTSGDVVSFSSQAGNGETIVKTVEKDDSTALNVDTSSFFQIEVRAAKLDVKFEGTVRRDAGDSADASCGAYGTTTVVG